MAEDRKRPRVHVLIPTHTTRHLAACLSSLAWQTGPLASVVVSCDTDGADIAALLDEWWPRVTEAAAVRGRVLPLLVHAYRPHQGLARLNQVRNNGLRALDGHGALDDSDLVVVLDGDTMLDPDAAHLYGEQAGAAVVIPYRVNTTEQTAAAVDSGAMLNRLREGDACEEVWRALLGRSAAGLQRRDRRYRRQLQLRRWAPWLTKPHKPKVLGGHHAVSVRCLRAINGYDEEYTGYGFDDDDLTRRLYRLRPLPRISIAVEDIRAYHLWHPTRAPARPTDAPGYARFARTDLPMVAAHGWRDPIPQPVSTVRVINPGVRVS